MAESIQERGHRKERVGEVVSSKMQKTIVVSVERRLHLCYTVRRFKPLMPLVDKFLQAGEPG